MNTKTLVLASLLAAGVATPVLAADIGYPVKAAAAPAAIADWNGFYLGGAIGATFGNTDYNYYYSGYDYGDYSSTSFNAGGYLGYNWQVSPSWVVGVELEGSWIGAEFEDDSNYGPFLKSDWTFALSARAGYLITPETLLYGKVGWALIDAELPGKYWESYGKSETLNGVQFGVGIESMLTRNWLVRVEGLYTVALDEIGQDYGGYYDYDYYDFKPDFLTARIGLAYKF